MADFAYRQILDKAMQTAGGLGLTGNRVYEDPAHPIRDGNLPAIAVEPVQDTVEHLGESREPGCIDRHELRIRMTAIGTTPVERDAVAVQLARSVLQDVNLGTRRRFAGVAGYPRNGEGQRDYFGAQLLFDIEFFTQDDEPDVLINPDAPPV